MSCQNLARDSNRDTIAGRKQLRFAVTAAAASMCLLIALDVPVALAAGPAAAKASSAEVKFPAFQKSIGSLYAMKERAWATGDVKTIVDRFYAPDAVSVGEGEPNVLVGRAQFLIAYRRYLRDVTSVRIESVRAFVNGNSGWDWANFYFTPKPAKARDYPPSPIRILFLWSKRQGRWVCEGEMFVNGKFKNPL